MDPFVLTVRLLLTALALLTATTASVFSQTRSGDLVRHCLSIVDVNERIDCLETGSTPGSQSTSRPASPTERETTNPSFDCGAARSSIERAICGDPTLSEWDARMGQLFQQALRSTSNRQSLLDEQRRWISDRDNRCGMSPDNKVWSCLLETTQLRFSALNKVLTQVASSPPAQSPPAQGFSTTSDRPASSDQSSQAVQPPTQLAQSSLPTNTSPNDGSSASAIGLVILCLGSIACFKIFRIISHNRRIADAQQHIEELRLAEEHRLTAKYGGEIAARILTHQVWQGMTEEQLIESRGSPTNVGREIIRDRTRETWKYHQIGRNRFRERIYLENGVVIGWKV